MSSQAQPRIRVRAAILFGVLGMLMLGALGRVAAISVGQHERYSTIAEANATRTTHLPAERGRIISKDGQILAQAVFSGSSVYINARQVPEMDRPSVAGLLAGALNLDQAELLQKLDRHSRNAGLPIKLLPTDKELLDVSRLMAQSLLPGVHFRSRHSRVYPKGGSGAQVIGFCSYDDNGRLIGAEGIEAAYQQHLSGTDGERVRRVDARGRTVQGPKDYDVAPVHGADLHVTLDATIQEFAEQAIAELIEKWDPDFACSVVIESRTGRVLAMVNAPGYDPNHFNTSKPEARTNHALSAGWEPGSIFKPLLLAAAIEDGLMGPDTPIPYKHTVAVGRRIITDGSHPVMAKEQVGADGGPGSGYVTATMGMTKSSNPISLFIAQSIFAGRVYPEQRYLVDHVLPYEGAGRLDARLRAFGFGEYSGIDIGGRRGGESRGSLPPADRWKRIPNAVINEIPSIAQGYAVQVTALQMLACFNAIANDGIRMRPFVVERVIAQDGTVLVENQPQVAGHSGFSPATARSMREILTTVTSSEGTARGASLEDWTLAGKTGTASISAGGSYGESDANTCSFVGFAPAHDPVLSIIVMARHPKKVNRDARGNKIKFYGGSVAAPALASIMGRSLAYLDVPRDRAIARQAAEQE